ncbi:uncharacterized protein CLIB1423_03S06942 [[Candida] railenensis]|uniref:LYC1 C-terminal domain-containing protein n=1 Tax=[Candida] railenensis TaxID=45579 RepID=A0A9P0QLP3_9ASCO|nr:uncharacterized protein CLIB1423_03S06942 [[Candida] railenensis]
MPVSKTEYELVELNDRDLISFTRAQNSQSWRGQLTSEQYIERECVLGKSKIASSKVNRLLVFMLRDKADPTSRLCSIELLIRRSWSYKYNPDSKRVERKDILSGCIGGVYTYPENRGKGLARIMVDKLVEKAKTEYLGEDGFTFLYSEVGEYYSRNGFKSFEVPLLKFPLGTEIINDKFIGEDEYQFSELKFHQFEELLQFHNTQFDKEIVDKVTKDGKPRVTINPNQDFIDWFHLRSKFISSKLFYAGKSDINENLSDLTIDEILAKFHKIEPDVFGFKISNQEGKLVGGIIWTYDWSLNKETNQYENYATVLKIIVDNKLSNQDDIKKQLILKMKSYIESKTTPAAVSDFKQVIIWQSEVNDTLLNWLTGNEVKGVPDHPNSSMSAVLINDPSENEKLVSGELIWEGNDKLPWF